MQFNNILYVFQYKPRSYRNVNYNNLREDFYTISYARKKSNHFREIYYLIKFKLLKRVFNNLTKSFKVGNIPGG